MTIDNTPQIRDAILVLRSLGYTVIPPFVEIEKISHVMEYWQKLHERKKFSLCKIYMPIELITYNKEPYVESAFEDLVRMMLLKIQRPELHVQFELLDKAETIVVPYTNKE